ncbi:MAG: tRNA threonylcarbamoyladenosine biosynthesis protein TsaE [Steroidobacteraceae bacterium]|nr:tRNA threonylcarbamoyladenosine biosynthesis protein TsaE [Steroidobacteraceae bacterium]
MRGFGAALARTLPSLEGAPLLLYLSGDLGAGKTTLARGLLAQLGAPGPVRSPTYTLVEWHALPALTVAHVDLYRLEDPHELEPLGLREAYAPHHLWIVEWPERSGEALPTADLHLDLSIEPAAHRMHAHGGTTRGMQWYADAVELVDVSH